MLSPCLCMLPVAISRAARRKQACCKGQGPTHPAHNESMSSSRLLGLLSSPASDAQAPDADASDAGS